MEEPQISVTLPTPWQTGKWLRAEVEEETLTVKLQMLLDLAAIHRAVQAVLGLVIP